MEISALTRTVVRRNHALICPDGYINSSVPGWTNCTVNVIISAEMGARLCQTLISCHEGGRLTGRTTGSEIFFYVVSGRCRGQIGGQDKEMGAGHFVYIPPRHIYLIEQAEAGTVLLSFEKAYEPLEGHAVPELLFGDAQAVEGREYLGDPALRLQVLLPENHSFDMAVNIFTYDPGGHLPLVETHIMEHGLLYLQGQGVYRLDDSWYPVRKGDSIWMGPYCQQWFTAMGKEPAVYIYYKNVNRHPRCQ